MQYVWDVAFESSALKIKGMNTKIDWLDAGYLGLIFTVELWLWGTTGLSWLVLTCGFICAVRGGKLSRMRNEGLWKRLLGKASNQC